LSEAKMFSKEFFLPSPQDKSNMDIASKE